MEQNKQKQISLGTFPFTELSMNELIHSLRLFMVCYDSTMR
jgi:hypothetical protein